MDEQLVVVKHCQKIVCRTAPIICPLCGTEVDYGVVPPPSYYPSPIVNAHRQRLTVVIKPTEGDWDDAVKSENDLHIGVTDLDGAVVNYFQCGVEKAAQGWESCLAVFRASSSDAERWDGVWVDALDDLMFDFEWSAGKYQENSHNCFDFVLRFLKKFYVEVKNRHGQIDELKDFGKDDRTTDARQTFIDACVLPKMNEAADYIQLLDLVQRDGYAKVT